MASICSEIEKWVTKEVTERVESWLEQQEEKCDKLPWWNPLKWFCWIVTTLVSVINWITKQILVRTTLIVCVFISWIIDHLLGWIPWFHNNFKACHFELKSKNSLPNGKIEFTFYCRCYKNCDDWTEVTVTAPDEETGIKLAKEMCNKTCK